MSTRSLIGTVDAATGRFRGRYVQEDGHPGTRGPVLTALLAHAGSLAHALDVLTQNHVHWAILGSVPDNYPHADMSLVEGYGLGLPAENAAHEDTGWINGVLGRPLSPDFSTEWGYVFTGTDEATAELVVFSCPDTTELARIPVRDLPSLTTRQWIDIECGTDLSRCKHLAWAHFEVPEEAKGLGTDTYLGRVPLAPRDATGARKGGRSYTLTGSGRSGGYAFGDRPAGERGHWYAAATDDRTGQPTELAIYRTQPERPLDGVELVYPPLHPDAPVPAGQTPPRLLGR